MSIEKISQSQFVEESTERLKRNFEAFFNTIDELLFVLDDQGHILHANDTVIERLGNSRE